MQQLIMNKKPIGGIIDFTENFSARDVLFQKEIAAGFFLNRMRNISPITQYHTEVFFQLQFCTPAELSLFKAPSDYLTKAAFARSGWSFIKKELLKKMIEEEKLGELAEKTWEIAHSTSLESPAEKVKLFCLLTAAYALARRSPDEKGFGISPEQAEHAYLGKPEPKANGGAELKLTADSPVIEIPARTEPYELHLRRTEAVKLLENGDRIKHTRLVADAHTSGINGATLTVNIFDEKGNKLYTETLNIGEYRYINMVGDCPVLVHPAPDAGQAESTLCRTKQHAGSYLEIKLTNGKGIIDDSHYADHINDPLSGFTAAELAFNNRCRIHLAPNGIIYEKGRKADKTKRYAAITDYLKK